MMAGPYLDYGEVGLVIVPFFLGLVYALIYRRVAKGSIYYITFYSLFVFPLIISFFAYEYALASCLYYVAILFVIKIWEVLQRYLGQYQYIARKVVFNDRFSHYTSKT